MFQISNVSPGEYEVLATLRGFDTARRAVRLQPGATVALSLTLSLGVREQVMVTAAKTGAAVDVQSIPMAVSAVSNGELTRLAIQTIEQAVPLLPSVTFTQNTTFGQLSIRGIGSNLPLAGSDPSSAMYIDGVYLARPAMVFADLLDLERVEVVRGPQGTLYGRNAVGGALNLISKAPTNDADASARLTAATSASSEPTCGSAAHSNETASWAAWLLHAAYATDTSEISITRIIHWEEATSSRPGASSASSSAAAPTSSCRAT